MIKNENYETIFERDVPDLRSRAYLLRHKKTGARVFILSNDDDNKVFYIGFRTPPEDSSGTPHIMEHSVLCGSEKYPLNDPFVELAKGSLNTFLNAITYPDKTVYPVASRNAADFKNLMSVYMDAVFRPNIYKHPEIMKQEGWSYRLESEDSSIEYNGVVYNEMKGAFSSPEGLLERVVMDSLFPDTAYGVESGGDPEHIPELTYEKFLDFHRRYYHPSNSYVYLYGDMDIEERLAWMDEEYFKNYDALRIDSEIKRQAPFKEMRTIEKKYPITDDEDEKNNTYLSYNIVCGDNGDAAKNYAMQMLVYALCDTQGAPIRQRLLDEGLCEDVLPSYENGILQPYFSITAKGSEKEHAERFLEIIKEEFEKAAAGDIDKNSLTASLNSLKFKYREADFGGYPKGLIYGLNSLDSWLYDDNKPLLHIESSKVFDELEGLIGTDYYAKLVNDYLLEGKHSSLVILTPEKGYLAESERKTREKLSAYKASLSKDEIKRLFEESKELTRYQEREPKKEELESIPLLKRSDIEREPERFSNIERSIGSVPYICHDYFTGKIAYVKLIFGANNVPVRLLETLSLLKSVVSFVDTDEHTFSELNNEINIYTGGFGFGVCVNSDRNDPEKYSLTADLTFKFFYENARKAFDLAAEALFKGKYDDDKRLREIVAETKSRAQATLLNASHTAASLRARSYYSKVSCINEKLNGIDSYKFIEELDKNFEERKEGLKADIKELLGLLLRPENILISCTADEEGFAAVEGEAKRFLEKFPEKGADAARKAPEESLKAGERFRALTYKYAADIKPEQKNEAFKTSSQVNYIARAGRMFESGKEYRGSINVFHTIMRYEYLWQNIRVKGGAYGCMCNTTARGDSFFVTYRDPNIGASNDIFEKIPEYLEGFDVDEREMTKFVIGTMSSVDMPLTPQAKGARDMAAYLSDTKYEDVQKTRHEIIDCTRDDIRALSKLVKKALSQGNICCIGNEGKIEEDAGLFKEIKSLIEQ